MSDSDVSRETPPSPAVAAEVFSDGLPLARQYARLLCSDGVTRGLIGPRETPRIWTRHILNCAVTSDAVGHGARVADVGSGAGLPGLVWAIRRPDLGVTLVEPMLRRTRFLQECVDRLGLESRVTVSRSRAEDLLDGAGFDVVTSRAVAPLPRLVGWCAPLCRPGGRIIAMKGSSAPDEIAGAAKEVRRVSDRGATVEKYGSDVLGEPALTIELTVDRPRR